VLQSFRSSGCPTFCADCVFCGLAIKRACDRLLAKMGKYTVMIRDDHSKFTLAQEAGLGSARINRVCGAWRRKRGRAFCRCCPAPTDQTPSRSWSTLVHKYREGWFGVRILISVFFLLLPSHFMRSNVA